MRNATSATPTDDQEPSGPSLMEIWNLVHKARTAPSGDNSQPWRFCWNGEVLKILLDDGLARHALNNRNHASWLSLGCLLELIKIAGTERGLEFRADLNLKDGPTGVREVARLRFDRTGVATDPLAAVVESRCTDRRPFRRAPVPESLLKELADLDLVYPSVRLRFRPEPSKEFLGYAVKSDEFLWKNPHVMTDFLHWTRLSRAESEARADGLPWQNLGIGRLDLLAMRLIRKNPMWVPRLWELSFRKKVNAVSRRLLTRCSGLLCIAIEQPCSPERIVEAGRLAYRAWLTLHAAGFGVQPHSLSSLVAFDVAIGAKPPGTSETFERHFQTGADLLRREFGFEANALPVWAFRSGPVRPLPRSARARRRPVDELLEF